jgi:vacuolar-type H+-ATPase subunit E/Vma4
MHTSGDPDGEVKPVAMAAKKAIEAGLETKKKVITTLRPALKHKAKLLEIKADKYYPEDYNAITATIVELIDLIEDGKMTEAKLGQKELLPRMHSNEVDTIEVIQ